ncbi:unnamed protein product [Musa acuminata subsp. malaccensis]|uniref:(wild Malaysian banana) hypothetical protein n=1 Tax=Musa acuminata subsp. malaccensis TaxID=214687 RepID=A0A8D7B9U7_MUSAM|nr:unnamed protein product [Musa acuminata subsp. malaccensis]
MMHNLLTSRSKIPIRHLKCRFLHFLNLARLTVLK